jgi:integrase
MSRGHEIVSNQRKSMRGQCGRVSIRRRGEEIRSWALAPIAVELIKAQMLARAARAHQPLLAYRDAAIVSLASGLALRPQETFGIRWSSLQGSRAYIDEVVSQDGLQSLGRTLGSSGRPVKAPSIMQDDLASWRDRLIEHGHRARDVDFVIPGNLVGSEFGVLDEETGAWHLSPNQIKKWGPRYMTPAVEAVADSDDAYRPLRGATPYGLRRGGISMRLRCEDAQSVAHQCGTSLEMLSQHYSYEIDDYGNHGPRSVNEDVTPIERRWSDAR